jgi:hypothetical protein
MVDSTNAVAILSPCRYRTSREPGDGCAVTLDDALERSRIATSHGFNELIVAALVGRPDPRLRHLHLLLL